MESDTEHREDKNICEFTITNKPYNELKSQGDQTWTHDERQIRIQFNDQSVVMFFACSAKTAGDAEECGKLGLPDEFTQILWLDVSFSNAAFHSKWATKEDKNQILAIHIARSGFDSLLNNHKSESNAKSDASGTESYVEVKWVPNHDPLGQQEKRLVLQVGVGRDILKRLNDEWIQHIQNITPFVVSQRECIGSGKLNELLLPDEYCYPLRESLDWGTRGHVPLLVFSSDTCLKKSTSQNDDFYEYELAVSNTPDNQEHASINGSKSDKSAESSHKQIILCLGGAFNPVHTRHIMAVVKAKEWLEQYTNYTVIAGRLAVAPDGYVKAKTRKSNDLCIKGSHRIRMCELACEHYRAWLQPYFKTIGSAGDCGKKTKQDFEKHGGYNDLQVAIIIGADRAITRSGAKWNKPHQDITICIGRQGETRKIIELYERDTSQGKMEGNFFIVPEELDNVSSTNVRRVLIKLREAKSNEEKRTLVDRLVDDGWICREEGQYIIQNEDDLYISD